VKRPLRVGPGRATETGLAVAQVPQCQCSEYGADILNAPEDCAIRFYPELRVAWFAIIEAVSLGMKNGAAELPPS
jgi:hypothetical protein